MDAKYLGVTLGNDLEWSHSLIATMTNKTKSKLSFLHRNLMDAQRSLSKLLFFDSLFYGVWCH